MLYRTWPIHEGTQSNQPVLDISKKSERKELAIFMRELTTGSFHFHEF
jgi:hypothetical protein